MIGIVGKKKEEWKVNENGTVSAFVQNVVKDILGDIRGTKGYSFCCKAEYPNIPKVSQSSIYYFITFTFTF